MPKRRNRVYFVGAGLSAAFGYPVGSRLVPELIAYPPKLWVGSSTARWSGPRAHRAEPVPLEAAADSGLQSSAWISNVNR